MATGGLPGPSNLMIRRNCWPKSKCRHFPPHSPSRSSNSPSGVLPEPVGPTGTIARGSSVRRRILSPSPPSHRNAPTDTELSRCSVEQQA